MAANPVQINIPGDSNVEISSICNAWYYQRVTLTIMSNTVVFGGSGEGTQMQTQDGQTFYNMSSRQGYTISALFEFSPNGPSGPFQQANVKSVVTTQGNLFTTIQIMTEDATDNDDNDTYMTIIYANV